MQIQEFTKKVFEDRKYLTLEDYHEFNTQISSEMFYSIMRVLHDTLPCSKNFFRLQKEHRLKKSKGSTSPIYSMASPQLVRGLGLSGNASPQSAPRSPIRINKQNAPGHVRDNSIANSFA